MSRRFSYRHQTWFLGSGSHETPSRPLVASALFDEPAAPCIDVKHQIVADLHRPALPSCKGPRTGEQIVIFATERIETNGAGVEGAWRGGRPPIRDFVEEETGNLMLRGDAADPRSTPVHPHLRWGQRRSRKKRSRSRERRVQAYRLTLVASGSGIKEVASSPHGPGQTGPKQAERLGERRRRYSAKSVRGSSPYSKMFMRFDGVPRTPCPLTSILNLVASHEETVNKNAI